MKMLFTLALVLMVSVTSIAQEKNIETESVALDNLINFMVDNYATDADSIPTRNITFLIETYADNFSIEDRVMLKQAFKLLSKRLKEDDSISIVTYSKFSGIALNQTEGTNTKKLLYAIENPRSSITYIEDDGIELAYKIAKKNFTEDTESSVVMVRIPNAKQDVATEEFVKSNRANKTQSNAVVLTAIALLPEIIKVIKNK